MEVHIVFGGGVGRVGAAELSREGVPEAEGSQLSPKKIELGEQRRESGKT